MEVQWKKKTEEHILDVKEKEGVTYLTYPLLEETGCVRHGFSTRLGGVSEGIFGTMNLSFARGDREEAVRENFLRMAAALEVRPDSYVCSAQTHTTNVREVTEADAGKGIVRERDYTDVDGLVTNVPGLCLATFYADCVPLFFVDPEKKAIGLAHSGWRGTVGKIGKATVEKMTERYGTNPEDIVAAIGPSICQDCYEVSGDVIGQFRSAYDEALWDALFYEKEDGKYQLDLWMANWYVLREAGIREEKIAVTNLCTCCNSELLFSHRASRGKRGNLGAFLSLK